MQAEEGRDLVVTPRDLDGVIAHGAALLGLPSTGPCSQSLVWRSCAGWWGNPLGLAFARLLP